MPINRYNTISEKNFNLYVPPVQAIGAALETAQKTYDTNFMFANELKNKYINALPQDRAAANELQTGWENQVDELVKKYNGDYSTASKDLYLLQKNIEKQYRQGGKAYAIESTYQTIQDSKKRNQERLAKGDVTQELYQSAYDYFDKNYKGVQKQADGTYSTASMPELAKSVDTLKAAREVVKDIKPRTVKENRRVDLGNGQYRMDTVEVSQVDPTEVRNAVAGTIASNDEYINYAKQLAQFTGRDPMDILNNELTTVYNAVGPAASGVFNDSRTMGETQMDPFAKMKLQHSYSMAEEYQKQKNRLALADAKGELKPSEPTSNLRLLATVNNEMSKYKPLNGTIRGVADAFDTSPTGVGINAALQATFPGLYNMGVLKAQHIASPGQGAPPTGTVADVIKAPNRFPNINANLLRQIKEQNPKYSDTQVMDQYDRSIHRQNQSEELFIEAYSNPKTGQDAAELMLPYLEAGNAKATFVGTNGQTRKLTPTEQQNYAAQIRAAKVGSLGQLRGFSGGLDVGEVLPVQGGYITMASNAIGISAYNENLRPKMFGFEGDARMAGDIFPLAGGQYAQGIKLPREGQDATGLKYSTTTTAYTAVNPDGSVKLTKEGTPDYFTVTETFPDGHTETRFANSLDMELKVLSGNVRNADIPVKTISASKEYNAKYEIH